MKKLILFIVVACGVMSCSESKDIDKPLDMKFEPKSIEAVASDTTSRCVISTGRSNGKVFQFSLRELRFRYIDEFVGSDSTRVEIPLKDSEWDKYTQTSFGAIDLPIKGDWYELTYDNEAVRGFYIKLQENKTNKVRKLRIYISNYSGFYTLYEVVQQP